MSYSTYVKISADNEGYLKLKLSQMQEIGGLEIIELTPIYSQYSGLIIDINPPKPVWPTLQIKLNPGAQYYTYGSFQGRYDFKNGETGEILTVSETDPKGNHYDEYLWRERYGSNDYVRKKDCVVIEK